MGQGAAVIECTRQGLHSGAMDGPAAARTAAALAQAARVGPFFMVEPWTPAGRWRPLRGLVSDPAALSERVGYARRALARRARIAAGEVEERVAASIVFGDLVSRLVSPQLGAAVLGGVVPDLTLADLWWRPAQRDEGGPWPLAAGPAGGTEVGDLVDGRQVRHAAELMAERAHALTSPVTAAFATPFRLSRRVLDGNVASALAGASAMLAGSCPARAEAAHRLTAHILALEPLRGTGEFVGSGPGGPRRQFVRHSCCLLYRVPGAGTCGDCVLTASRSRLSDDPEQVGAGRGERGAVPGQQPAGDEHGALGGELLRAVGRGERVGLVGQEHQVRRGCPDLLDLDVRVALRARAEHVLQPQPRQHVAGERARANHHPRVAPDRDRDPTAGPV